VIFSIQDRFAYQHLNQDEQPSQWSWCKKIGEVARSVLQTCAQVCTVDHSLSWKERAVSWLKTVYPAAKVGGYAGIVGTAFCTGAYGVVGILAGNALEKPVVIVEGSIVIVFSTFSMWKAFQKILQEREDYGFLDLPGSLAGFVVGTWSGVYGAIILGTAVSDKMSELIDFIVTSLAAGSGGLSSFPVGFFTAGSSTAVVKVVCTTLVRGAKALKDGCLLYRERRDSCELNQLSPPDLQPLGTV